MAPKKPDKKQVEACKKKIKAQVKKLAEQTKKDAPKIQKAQETQKKLKGKKDKDLSPDEKNEKKDAEKVLKSINDSFKKYSLDTSKQINLILKKDLPDDKSELEAWEKDLAPWYLKIIKSEKGLQIPNTNVRVSGDLSVKKKEGMIIFNGKF